MVRGVSPLQNSAQINILFPYGVRKTALFQHIKPISKPVKTFDPSLSISTPNRYSNYDYYWLHTDIAVAYDPCTCNDNGKSTSKIEFQFSLETVAVVDLNGEIDGSITVDNVYQQGNPPVLDAQQVSVGPYSFDPTKAKNLINNGQRYYKEYEGFGNSVNSWLDDQNASFKDKTIKDWYLDKYGVSASQTDMNTTFNNTLNTPEGKKELFGIKLNDPLIGKLKTVTSLIPYAGAIWGIVDYLNTGGREDEVNNTPVQEPPHSIHATMSLKGKITTKSPLAFPLIYTPGTKLGTGASIPKYNNILGVVNIMNVPNLIYDSYTPEVFSLFNKGPVPVSAPEIRQFRLENQLRIVLNPAAGLDLVSVEAAFVLEYEDDFMDVFDINSPLNISLVSDYMTYEPLIIGDMAILSANDRFKALERMGFHQEFMHQTYGQQDTKLRLRTDYVPLGALEELSFPLVFNSLTGSKVLKEPKIYLKVVYRLLPKNDFTEDRNPIMLVHSYEFAGALDKAKLNETSTYYGKSQWEIDDIIDGNDIPFYIKEFDELLHPNPYMHSTVTASSYSSQYNLQGDINTKEFAQKIAYIGPGNSPYYHLQNGGALIATRNVWLENGIMMLPNSKIELSPVGNDFDVDDIYASENDITYDCNSNEYKDNMYFNTKRDLTASIDKQLGTAASDRLIEINIYPNPTVNTINIQSEKSYDVTEIIDMEGRIVYRSLTWSTEIDVSVLSTGMYILKFYTNNELSTYIKFEKNE